MDTAVIWHEDFAQHDSPGHPEGASRLTAVVDHLRTGDLWPRLRDLRPRAASEEDILRVHTRDHLVAVRLAAAGGGWLDPDTYVCPASYDLALLAAGGVVEATRLWDEGTVSFALVRPPGHHATPDRAMGFCLFNNVAVAAASLLDKGLGRVAIVDWDVHHGNGTQEAFYGEPRVLFVSLHEWPLYPGSGAVDQCGAGAGLGCTVNIPLPSGCVDGDYAYAFQAVVEPVVAQFSPQALLVSAGQDPHADDPLGGMELSAAGFGDMAARCARLANEHCGGRLALALEGGYDRPATACAVAAILKTLLDGDAPCVQPVPGVAGDAVERARAAQSVYWDL